ncbi:MAG: ATP-binding protein [Myxococcota bacterium]|nr:ATP-binding protein [Myxococcota bacterium]
MNAQITDELAREVFIHGPVVVFRWRNEPGWPVELCTPNVLEIFGYSAADFLRGTIAYADCIHPDDLQRVQHEVVRASDSRALAFEHEPYRIRRADGSVRWLYDFTRIQRDERGDATHYFGYVIDVTARIQAQEEKRELERQLLQAQKLESLGLLAGGVAHDFNNLLTGILGQTNLAQLAILRAMSSSASTVPGPDTPSTTRSSSDESLAIAEHLREIETLTLRAAELTRQLLAYTGQGQQVVEPLDLGELAGSMLGMLRVLVGKNVTLDLAPELPPVRGDRTQLQQIVMNLVTNGADALGETSGTVRISVRDEVGARWSDEPGLPSTRGTHVVLEIEDDGCGMEEEARTRLFEPFFTTKERGRGLGLAAVLGIVRGHDGEIRLRSEPGRGTRFLLVFPACSEPAVRPAQRPIARTWRGEGLALVVDDEPAVRQAACAMLVHLGFTTVVAEHGAAALAMLEERSESVSVVLLDRAMPVMNGAETLRVVRERHPALRVVMTSGFDVGAPLALGPRERFLAKPFRLAELRAVLRELFD